jgi:fatty acyl-CoA reductase
MSLKDLEQKYGHFIRMHPNTYSFTKKLTENLLVRERGKVPLAIVRPGIILNSWRAPFPGWVDNVNSGACGFIAGAVKGIFCT